MKYVLGLTGGSGAGKSDAAAYLKKSGAYIIDADEVSRSVTAKGGCAVDEIDAAFPGCVTDGVLNRKKLAEIVFNDGEKLELLNKITHKHIIKRIEDELQRATGVVVLDAPTLYEAGCDRLCDSVLFVDADENVRALRIIARDGLTEKQAMERINARPIEDFKKKADYVVTNNDGMEGFFSRLDTIMKGIKLGNERIF